MKNENRNEVMLLYIGNSRWTSANRNHAVHICGTDRRPLCGKRYQNGVLDVFEGEMKEVTCDKCKRILLRKPREI